jgi:hypothetical protein
MAGVTIYQRAPKDFDFDPSARGHHVVYRANESNRCPGCGRAQWFVGRVTAECGFCGTAIALAEAKWAGGAGDKPYATDPVEEAVGAERRRHERVKVTKRTLQLLIEDSPLSFALHDISAGGVKGEAPVALAPRSLVHVRFEGGILVPAEVRWSEDNMIGLAFKAAVLVDTSRAE